MSINYLQYNFGAGILELSNVSLRPLGRLPAINKVSKQFVLQSNLSPLATCCHHLALRTRNVSFWHKVWTLKVFLLLFKCEPLHQTEDKIVNL